MGIEIGPATVTRVPTVTVGQATGEPLQSVPKVTVGRAYALGVSAQAGGIEIRELTGDERQIFLRERALPYKPLIWGGTQRIEESDYAGFPRTSQQALGAKENESEWNGCWKTRFIGDPDTPRMAELIGSSSTVIDGVEGISVDSTSLRETREITELFDDVRRKGQVCKVSWAHITRIGRLAEFEQKWLTIHDCEWRMKWKWIGRDEDVPSITAGSGAGASLLEMSSQMSSGFVDLYDATNLDDIDDLDPSLADRIDSRVGRMQRAILGIEDAIETRSSSITGPIESVRRGMEISTFIRDEAELFIAEMDAICAPGISFLSDPTEMIRVEAGVAFRNAIALRQSVRAARAMKHRAARQRYVALRQLDANALAVIMMAQDEDVTVLAERFYGNHEEGLRIRLYNGLNSNTAPAGTVIIIPRIDGDQ